ncbi:hypothetical protein [Oceanicoccus sagamiensis]|uniref:Uncharacterized protein n=1 Tax=Oceanicoccus sagamiensis TaxID=716816 RepID=A0A1X9ND04_9GAMM|nr:hypothetical protein [Oceanicoccus sagamiensis]ARN73409.1 hypothetical protein BST96_04350 [Oceanicoccus sagamiensis]
MKFGPAIKIILTRAICFPLCLLFAISAHAGSCNYTQENMFAGPFKVCAESVDQARCEEFATEGSNADASYDEASCSTDSSIGVCTLEQFTLTYYTGNAEDLEVGCSFQGGDWT